MSKHKNKKNTYQSKPKYCYANTFSEWLKMKYNISYKTFRKKSKKRREELKMECENECNAIHFETKEEREARLEREEEYENAMQILYDCGVPFDDDGDPLGIPCY